jgi:hypothetical protein
LILACFPRLTAVLPDHLAVVYYDYLPRMPGGQSNLSDTAVVLGCVIAHELGHLLLATHRHSIARIRQESWGVEQTRRALMSRLSFLPEEARLMHADKKKTVRGPRSLQSAEVHTSRLGLEIYNR